MPRARRPDIGRQSRRVREVMDLRAAQTVEERAQANERTRMSRSEARNANRRVSANVVLNQAAFHYDPTINYSAHPFVIIGTMSVLCQHCKALKFSNEAPGLCCANGKVKLQPLISPPEPLRSLLYGEHQFSKHFLANIQQYNGCFQMTSFGAEIVEERGYNPTFKVIF